MNERKKTYQEYCLTHENEMTLFFQPYWLDAVAGEEGWDCVVVKNNDEVKAVMPFALGKKYGMTVINNPPLTPHTGIHFLYPHNIEKEERKIAFENKITEEVISKIPKHLYFHVCFHPGYKNWLAFHWKGFRQSTKYTYVVSADLSVEQAYEEIKSKTKNVIRKAEGELEISQGEEVELFYELNRKTYKRQGMEMPFSLDTLRRLDKELVSRRQRKLYLASDKEGNYHAGIYIVNDNKKSYCLAIGSDPEHRASGAISLLLWAAIKEAIGAGRGFDFEGSMMPNIEPIFRSFGAEQVPYYRIYGSRNKWTHALFALLGKW